MAGKARVDWTYVDTSKEEHLFAMKCVVMFPDTGEGSIWNVEPSVLARKAAQGRLVAGSSA